MADDIERVIIYKSDSREGKNNVNMEPGMLGVLGGHGRGPTFHPACWVWWPKPVALALRRQELEGQEFKVVFG